MARVRRRGWGTAGPMLLMGLLVGVAAWPAAAQGADVCAAEDAIAVERPSPGSVRIRLANPCRAGTLARFEHDGAEVAALVGPGGVVELERPLGPGPNRVSLVDEGEPPRLLFEGEGPEAAAPAEGGGAACPPTKVAVTTLPGGLARLGIEDRCAPGAAVRVAYVEQGLSFRGRLDAAGRGEVGVSLVDPLASLEVAVEGWGTQPVAAPFPDHGRVVKALLAWDAPVDLDLHVVEPDGRLGGPTGVVSAAVPNRAGGRALGRLERADDGKGPGGKLEAYVLEDAARAAGGSLGLLVSDASRGRLAAGEHCGAGRLAGVPYRLITLAGGQVRARRYALAALPCGRELDDAAFYVPVAELPVR